MADTTSAGPASLPDGNSTSSTGIRSLWARSGKKSTSQSDDVREQEPGRERKSNRLSNFLRWDKSTSTNGSPGTNSDKGSAAVRRRQQVYQAQKRHRNRKAEYVQALEAEIARLQHLDSVVTVEKDSLARANEAMKALLASHSLDAQLGMVNLDSATSNESTNYYGSACIDKRLDEAIGQTRYALEATELTQLGTSSDPASTDVTERGQQQFVKGDSMAALDFILALEWPCHDHVHHDTFNPIASDPDGWNGHALTMTNFVLSSALPPSSTPSKPELSSTAPPTSQTDSHWHIPHSEIDKLVKLSEQLPLDEEQMTPAMAYAVIRQSLSEDTALRPALELLKAPLGSLSKCSGFGSWIPVDMFWQQLDAALQQLQQRSQS